MVRLPDVAVTFGRGVHPPPPSGNRATIPRVPILLGVAVIQLAPGESVHVASARWVP